MSSCRVFTAKGRLPVPTWPPGRVGEEDVVGLEAMSTAGDWSLPWTVTLTPPAQAGQRPSEDAVVTVAEQELGRVITLGVSVTREQAPAAVNALSGVVTRAGESGEVAAGDVLYAVAQQPVITVQGELPQWRALGEGATGVEVGAAVIVYGLSLIHI